MLVGHIKSIFYTGVNIRESDNEIKFNIALREARRLSCQICAPAVVFTYCPLTQLFNISIDAQVKSRIIFYFVKLL